MNETEGIERYVLAQESWALALQGVLVLIVGFLILLWPVMTMDVLVIFIGAFAFVSGIFALVAMTKAEKGRRGILILQGVVGIIFGIMLFAWPIASAAMLLWFIMAWLLVSGIFKIVAAVQLPSGDASKWLLGLDGFFSMIIGIMLISLPGIEGLFVMCLLIGFYAIFAGIALISLSFMVKSTRAQSGA